MFMSRRNDALLVSHFYIVCAVNHWTCRWKKAGCSRNWATVNCICLLWYWFIGTSSCCTRIVGTSVLYRVGKVEINYWITVILVFSMNLHIVKVDDECVLTTTCNYYNRFLLWTPFVCKTCASSPDSSGRPWTLFAIQECFLHAWFCCL